MAKKRSRLAAPQLTLMPVDTHKRLRVRIAFAVAFAAAIILAWFGGDISGRYRDGTADEQLVKLRVEAQLMQKNLKAAREELALNRTSVDVAQQAQNQVRGEMKELRGQMAEMEEAVAFYKNVMSPGSGQQGLRIEKLDLAAGAEANTYHYRLVLSQVGDNRKYVSGTVSLLLLGRQDEQPVRLSTKSMLDKNSETQFRFRYFQELTGSLYLPEDVLPEQLGVEVKVGSRRSDHREKTFIWQLQERASAWAG